jgi:hypothetical protein
MTTQEINSRNRRVAPRRPARSSIKISCLKGSLGLGNNLALCALDISETGVRLVAKAALAKGQEIEVSLMGPGQSRPFKVMAEVVWCSAAADGTFCMGARFQKRLLYKDFREIAVATS